jgi:hypothetical protein
MLAPVRCPLKLVDVLRRKTHRSRSEAFDLPAAPSGHSARRWIRADGDRVRSVAYSPQAGRDT